MKLTIRTPDGSETTREITSGRVVIGREETCDIVLNDDEASREHAAIEVQSDGRTLISDLGSRNGTLVNGRRIAGPTVLGGGETIKLGASEISVAAVRSSETVLSPRDQSTRAQAQPQSPTTPPPRTSDAQRATIIAAVAAALALAAIIGGVLFATGVIGGTDEEDDRAEAAEPVDENRIPEIIEEARPATANIITHAPEPVGRGGGTGWVLDAEEGLVVTASHVVEQSPRYTVEIGGERKRAQLIAAAPCNDLALLRILDPEGLEEMPLGSQKDLQQGDPVVALGFPVNTSVQDKLVATSGIVSQVKTTWRENSGPEWPIYRNMVQTDAAINPGNSGGPLVNEEGELVGVNVATGGGQNENYAIGVDLVKTVIENLRQERSEAWSGMSFAFGVEGVPGMLNLGAVPGTPADFEQLDEDGLLLDHVTHINGRRVRTIRQYCAAVGEATAGDSARYRFVDSDTGDSVVVSMAFK